MSEATRRPEASASFIRPDRAFAERAGAPPA